MPASGSITISTLPNKWPCTIYLCIFGWLDLGGKVNDSAICVRTVPCAIEGVGGVGVELNSALLNPACTAYSRDFIFWSQFVPTVPLYSP